MGRLTKEQSLCLNCTTPVQFCGSRYKAGKDCAYNLATRHNPSMRIATVPIQQSCGFAEIPLFPLNFGMTDLAERVLAYKEPWMRLSDWHLTNG